MAFLNTFIKSRFESEENMKKILATFVFIGKKDHA